MSSDTEPMLGRLTYVRHELQGVINLASNVLEDSAPRDVTAVITHVWDEIRQTLENILGTSGPVMDSLTLRGPYPDMEQGRHIECHICNDGLPCIVLLPCHHTLCPRCSMRVYSCPFCRQRITSRFRIYFDR